MAVAEIPRRNLVGWVILACLLALLIGVSLVSYLEQGEPGSLSRANSELQLLMRQRTLMGGAESEGYREKIREILATLDPHPDEPVERAVFRSVLRYEVGETPSEEDLAAMAASDQERVPAYADLYQAESLTPDEAKDIIARLTPARSSVAQLAHEHAREKSGESANERRDPLQMAMMGGGILAVGFAGLAWWTIYFYRRAIGKLPAPALPTGPISLYEADALAMRCAQLLLVFLTVQFASGLWNDSPLGVVAETLLGVVLLFGLTALVLRVPVFGFRLGAREIGVRFDRFWGDVAWGFGAAIANIPILMVTAVVSFVVFRNLPPPTHPIETELTGGTVSLLLVFLQAVIVAPIIEELIFRGALFPALARVARSLMAGALISGFLFAAIHPQGIVAWGPLMAVGAVLAFVAAQRRSLTAAIVMHAVHNGAILGMNFLIR